jgi:hypothetical protein
MKIFTDIVLFSFNFFTGKKLLFFFALSTILTCIYTSFVFYHVAMKAVFFLPFLSAHCFITCTHFSNGIKRTILLHRTYLCIYNHVTFTLRYILSFIYNGFSSISYHCWCNWSTRRCRDSLSS